MMYTALPRARGMKRSQNLMEGDTLELHCEPWGWPKPTVSWRREAAPLNFSDPRITADNDTNKLIIESVVLEDRDYYHCIVSSRFNDTNYEDEEEVTLVRVKGMFLRHKKLVTATT